MSAAQNGHDPEPRKLTKRDFETDQAVPRRLIVTYRLLPGQPNFIAEFSDWKFAPAPDTDFVFQPPAGFQQVELKPAEAATPGARGTK